MRPSQEQLYFENNVQLCHRWSKFGNETINFSQECVTEVIRSVTKLITFQFVTLLIANWNMYEYINMSLHPCRSKADVMVFGNLGWS